MPTYLLTLAYDGTKFSCWQIQRRYGKVQGRTVQAECEKVLHNIPGFTGKITF